jgi:hypothetical protein
MIGEKGVNLSGKNQSKYKNKKVDKKQESV